MLLAMVEGGGLTRFLSALLPTGTALGLQAVAFLITARGLGVEAFGQYAAVLAIAAMGVELIGIGSADLLVRAVSRDQATFPGYFGAMLAKIVATWPVVTLLGAAVAVFGAGSTIPLGALLIALAAEMLVGRVSASVELVMVAHHHTGRASLVRMTTAGTRLIAALAYFGLARGLDGWIVAVAVQSALLSAMLIAVAARLYGRPAWVRHPGEARDGVPFTINQFARMTQSNLDRVVLSRFVEDAVVGAYSAGARMLQLGLFPLQVATRILYPHFFVHGERGIDAARRFAIGKLPMMLATGILAGAFVAIGGLAAPFLLGHGFGGTSRTAALLALSIPLIGVQYLGGDVLTGAGYQHLRATVYAVTAVVFALALVAGARLGGVDGLIAAFVALQGVLAAVLWTIVFRLAARERRAA